LLGPYQATLSNGSAARFEIDSARALLAYLSIEIQTQHRREALAYLLWPEHPEASSLKNLRQALSVLRQAIGDKDASPPYLIIDRKNIQFNPQSNYRLDVAEFINLIADVQEHPHRRIEACRPCLERLQQAADLYQGDFLTGFSIDSIAFEEWIRMQRERYHQQAMKTLYQLATYHEWRGDYENAQRYARRQIELESWSEEAHQQLMRTLALGGRRGAALAQYETCCRILEEELAAEPMPETIELHEQIRSGQLKAPRVHAAVHNLPTQLTPLIGRANELAQVAEHLNGTDCRLLTLTGPGGIGKTRLALQAAQEAVEAFRDGVYFVPLESLSSPDLLASAIIATLGVTLGENPQAQTYRYLHDKEMLLVLDNFEHLLESADIVTDILQQASDVSILVTSRQRLNVPSEWVFELQGLSYPKLVGQAAPGRFSAVQLFTQTARRIQPNFTLSVTEIPCVTEICRIVEGMPLAIEMATSWLRVLSCTEIIRELYDNLDLFTTTSQDVPDRHRSLQAVFDHSWRLLSTTEQATFARLSVFRGGFDRAAAKAVTGATVPILAALLDSSLIQQATIDQTEVTSRYKMHSLIQQYAAGKLIEQPDEQAEAQAQHSAYFTAFLKQHTPVLVGKPPRAALDAIDMDIENVRAAWAWAVAHHQLDGIDQALDSLFEFYDTRGYLREGKRVLGQAIAALMPAGQSLDQLEGQQSDVMSRLLAYHGWFALRLGRQIEMPPEGEPLDATDAMERALAMMREDDRINRAALMVRLGIAYEGVSNYLKAEQYFGNALALARQCSDKRSEVAALNWLSQIARLSHNIQVAALYAEDALKVAREAGASAGTARALANLGILSNIQNDVKSAKRHLEESLSIYHDIGDRLGIAEMLSNLGTTSVGAEDYDAGKTYTEEALAIYLEVGDRAGVARALSNLGNVEYHLENYAVARQHTEDSVETFRDIGELHNLGASLTQLAFIELHAGNLELAAAYLQEALQITAGIHATSDLMFALVGYARLCLATGNPERSAMLVGLIRQQPAATQITRLLQTLHADLEAAMPQDELASATARGESMTIQAVLAEIAAESLRRAS
jgi:predicted ATPase